MNSSCPVCGLAVAICFDLKKYGFVLDGVWTDSQPLIMFSQHQEPSKVSALAEHPLGDLRIYLSPMMYKAENLAKSTLLYEQVTKHAIGKVSCLQILSFFKG